LTGFAARRRAFKMLCQRQIDDFGFVRVVYLDGFSLRIRAVAEDFEFDLERRRLSRLYNYAAVSVRPAVIYLRRDKICVGLQIRDFKFSICVGFNLKNPFNRFVRRGALYLYDNARQNRAGIIDRNTANAPAAHRILLLRETM